MEKVDILNLKMLLTSDILSLKYNILFLLLPYYFYCKHQSMTKTLCGCGECDVLVGAGVPL